MTGNLPAVILFALAMQSPDAARFLGLDMAGWTLVFAVLAVVVPLALHWMVRQQKATVWIIDHDGQPNSVARLGVVIRNDGEPDLMIRQPAEIVIERGSPARGKPIPLKVVKAGSMGFNSSAFPLRISTEDELTSLIQRSVLADELWLRDCIDSCWVRGVYRTSRGRPFRSAPFRVPVDEWLPLDASARQTKPRP